MSHMILRPKHGSWMLYPSDRPAEREFFDTEAQARNFAAKHYKGVEVIVPPPRNRDARPEMDARQAPEAARLTLGYYFAQAAAKKAGGQSQ